MADPAAIAAAKIADKAAGPWLHAWHDPLAGLKTVTGCVRFADLNGDGDSKLCVCDFEKKLKVYKGTSLVVEYALLDVPVAMCITYTETSMPRIPSIAVAAGSNVFIYRQMRPYRKWTCPPIDIPQVETDIWNDLRMDIIDSGTAVKLLTEARDSGTMLSSRSSELLSIESDAERSAFVSEMKVAQYQQLTSITCMEILKKDSEDIDALSMLVVGTEAGDVMILPHDPNNSNYQCKVKLPSTPVMMTISGTFDVEWRVSVACRDGKLYNIKNGDVRGTAVLSGAVVDLSSQAVAMTNQDKLLWVATMDRMVSCFTSRGKRAKAIVLTDDVTELCVVLVKKAKVSHLLMVALATGEVRMYKEGAVVHSFVLDKPVTALRYGAYGREESCLACVHGSSGSLTIKIWRRAADVDAMNANTGPPPEQDVPLPVPKKTKLYVEQTQREREHAPDMHRAFQRDLCKLRLETARAYVKTLTDGHMGASPLGSQDVRVHAQVQGLGPKFLLKVSLQNAGSQPLLQSRLLFTFDPDLYVMGHDANSNQCINIPFLLPGPKHIFETEILNIDPQGRAGQIMLLLHASTSGGTLPMLSASVRMPASELLTI